MSGQPADPYRFVMFVITLANVALLAESMGNVLGTCFNPVVSYLRVVNFLVGISLTRVGFDYLLINIINKRFH